MRTLFVADVPTNDLYHQKAIEVARLNIVLEGEELNPLLTIPQTMMYPGN
jgi:hypothetical protein